MSSTTGNRHGSAVITQPSDTEILITRTFDAPAELLFKAYTTPDQVKQWWGFQTSEWVACEVDLRVGGRWRFVVRDEGMEVGFHGEYREIEPPHRIVQTEVYEGAPVPDPDAFPTVNVITFDEVEGVTTLTMLVQCIDREQRDAVIESGMESGLQVAYDQLEDLVRQQG
jgi:uncharacterized protein YndB with AHSA1/START domain